MTKEQKTALKRAANAIDGTTGYGVVLGADGDAYGTRTDFAGNQYSSVYLSLRGGRTIVGKGSALLPVCEVYGLTPRQVVKMESVANSTHNLKQRSQRVANFLRRCVDQPGYEGLPQRANSRPRFADHFSTNL
jgi:hypothetical protein